MVDDWHLARPDLPVDSMQIWSRIVRLGQHLDTARRAAFSAHGLEVWEFDVLAALRRAGQPYQLSPGELLAQTHVTSGTMTNRVDRMSERGLVSRSTRPDDGRRVRVQLTASGKQRVDAALESLLQTERELSQGLDSDQLAVLESSLRTLLLSQSR